MRLVKGRIHYNPTQAPTTCLTIFCATSVVVAVPLAWALLLPAAPAAVAVAVAAPNLACAKSGMKKTGSWSWKKLQSAGARPGCICMKGE